jgi:hypothetical protein
MLPVTSPFPDKKVARQIVPPRRGAVLSPPGLMWRQAVRLQEALFSEFGLEDLAKCTTGEMPSRPIPQFFNPKQVEPLRRLYAAYAPDLFAEILPQLKVPLQPLNRISKLGWPHFNRPESKRPVVLSEFKEVARRGVDSYLQGAFVSQNVRLQDESPKKTRSFQFIGKDGVAYNKQVSGPQREIPTPVGPRTGSRTRLVFNYPVLNLVKQVYDTAIHNTLLTYPVFHHNMYERHSSLVRPDSVRAFDIKHMERFTAGVIEERGEVIGGNYGKLQRAFLNLPFLCPSDDWKSYWLVKAAPGSMVQFGSGDSAVAPSQKEAFYCVYRQVVADLLGLRGRAGHEFVLKGGDSRLQILNYGDDNFVSGDPSLLKEVGPLLASVLDVEEEDPPAFLGFAYREGRFELRPRSYLVKTYLNERPPGRFFRKYPYFGWREKRKTYMQYGDQVKMNKIFAAEDSLLARTELSWREVLLRAQEEENRLAKDAGSWRAVNLILGKEYLLTAEEKLASGQYEGLSREEAGEMFEWLKRKD